MSYFEFMYLCVTQANIFLTTIVKEITIIRNQVFQV